MRTKKTWLVILGAGFMQVPAIKAAASQGLRTLVFDKDAEAIGAEYATAFFPIDLRRPDLIYRQIKKLGLQAAIAGVFTAGTDFSLPVAILQKKLGLPGNTVATARNASHKQVMRAVFAKHSIPSPRYVSLGSRGRLFAGAKLRKLRFPVVVKPVDNMGARGVLRVDSPDRLPGAVASAVGYSRSRTCIVEEFIEGAEYSIDSLFQGGKLLMYGIAVRHIQFPPYFIETGHSFPSGLSPKQEDRMLEVFCKGVAALGIRDGAAKGDVFFGPNGPVIGEIAARLSGGYMSGWTLPYASGLDFTGAAVEIAVGKQVDAQDWKTNNACFERAAISFPGRVAGIELPPEVEDLPGFRQWFPRVEPGGQVVFPRNNVEKAGNFIVSGPDPAALQETLGTIFDNFLIRLAPDDSGTRAAILDPAGAGVPPAYPLNLAGTAKPDERSWDGRTYRSAEAFLFGKSWQDHSGQPGKGQSNSGAEAADAPAGRAIAANRLLLERVLQRCGLQAALVLADILRYGNTESTSWLGLVEKAYA